MFMIILSDNKHKYSHSNRNPHYNPKRFIQQNHHVNQTGCDSFHNSFLDVYNNNNSRQMVNKNKFKKKQNFYSIRSFWIYFYQFLYLYFKSILDKQFLVKKFFDYNYMCYIRGMRHNFEYLIKLFFLSLVILFVLSPSL